MWQKEKASLKSFPPLVCQKVQSKASLLQTGKWKEEFKDQHKNILIMSNMILINVHNQISEAFFQCFLMFFSFHRYNFLVGIMKTGRILKYC